MQDTPLGMSTPLNTTFADWESKVLIEAIQIHFKEAATPRSIRAFVLRYQLARLLLQQLSHGTDMTMLADALAVALKGDRTKIRKDIPEALQWAVKHVI